MLKNKYCKKYRGVLTHTIRAEEVRPSFGVTTKLDASWGLNTLFDVRRKCAKEWVAANFDKIGKVTSVQLEADYLDVAVQKGR